jgi:hypothetical protein
MHREASPPIGYVCKNKFIYFVGRAHGTLLSKFLTGTSSDIKPLGGSIELDNPG